MNISKIFVPGDRIYCLISSTSEPNLLIPVKVEVIDVEQHIYNPKYIIQIIKFYDSLRFIKEHFLSKNFKYARRSSTADNKIKHRTSQNKARQYDIDSIEDLEALFNGDIETSVKKIKTVDLDYKDFTDYKERHYLIIDSLFCYKTKFEMLEALNQITDFMVF